MLKYKRISLKLSGEAMGGAQAVDFDKAEAIAKQVARLHELGAEIGITIGGGNIWRGRSSGDMDRNRADQMGMLATVINSLAVQDCLLKLGVPTVVMSSIDMRRSYPDASGGPRPSQSGQRLPALRRRAP